MAENAQVPSANAPKAEPQGQVSSPAPEATSAPFDKDAFLAEYTKREKDAIAKAIAPLQKEIKRLSALASLKELPDEQREALADRGHLNADAAEMVKVRFNLPDDLDEDILARGSYREMVKYGERMAKIMGTSRNEAASIAQELVQKMAESPTNVERGAATETIMPGSTGKVFNGLIPATKDTIDKLWLDAEEKGGSNPYAEQYRKFLATGSL